MLKVGVGLTDKGLFSEGEAAGDTALAQTGRRTTRLDMPPFTIDTEQGRRRWRQLLLALEQRIVLADAHPGMLADELSDYLFARSTGHIGALMTFINRGCQRAVRSGAERLTRDLLDQVRIDAAAEQARAELEHASKQARPPADRPVYEPPGEHRTSDPADPVRAHRGQGARFMAGVPRRTPALPLRRRAALPGAAHAGCGPGQPHAAPLGGVR
ncbi:hypothetical protein [Streptomyces sp. CA-179760]|uniref:hypothetical protein n=1 Tax=Streptomyces sp. CA-179760 TaxID=3240054 RepID=UPI003D8A03A6